MTLKEKLQTAWNNRHTIAEGFYNAYVSSTQEVKDEAQRRISICRTNECSLHDPEGKSEKAVFKGQESCGGCGCLLNAKVAAMSAYCALKDIGQKPLWEEVTTQEQEQEFNSVAYQKQIERYNK